MYKIVCKHKVRYAGRRRYIKLVKISDVQYHIVIEGISYKPITDIMYLDTWHAIIKYRQLTKHNPKNL